MNKLHQIFKSLDENKSFFDLENFIFEKIQKEKEKRIKRKVFFSHLSLGISGVGALATWSFFGQPLLQSEFWNMFSLFFSDAGTVFENFEQFGLSLLETLPALNLAVILIPITLLFSSIGFYLDTRKNQKIIFAKTIFA